MAKNSVEGQGFIFYGYEFNRKKSVEKDLKKRESFAPPENQDGAVVIDSSNALGGFASQYYDFDANFKTEQDLIRKYREISTIPEVSAAVEDITNEGITITEFESPVSVNLDDVDLKDAVKDAIIEEFEYICKLLKFNTRGYDLFKKWYIDSKIYFHKIVDTNSPAKGIREIRHLDPINMRKIREIEKEMDDNGVQTIKQVQEYYIYIPSGSNNVNQAIRIAPDTVTFVGSGVYDSEKKIILGHMYKAIKPANQLRMMEDAVLIYRISRAPERRVFYIDVGSLPTSKAEQYLQQQMSRYRNKLVYNAETGEMRDDKRHMSMMEDFWLPRREGGRGTEIDTLPGGQQLGDIEDLDYFKKKLYKSLNVPVSRLEPEAQFSLGRSSEITRDELKFSKFIIRLRAKFNEVFLDLLKTQLVLKGILKIEEWDQIYHKIRFDYKKDTHTAELKDLEILQERMNILRDADQYVGKYLSREYVRKNILFHDDEEIKEIDKEIEADKKKYGEEDDDDFGGGRRF